MTRLLYLECTAGISGDMAAAALLDAGASEEVVRRALDSLDVEGFAVEISRVVKSGLDVCDFAVVLDAAHENHDHDMAYLHGREREDGREREEGGDREGSCVGGDGYGYGLDGERECGGGRGHGRGHGRSHGHGRGHSHDGGEGAGHHRGPREIEAIIDGATMTEEAKATARRIFELVAQAEARAHGVPLGDVHFHEVGAVDSIADIVAIAAAFDDLNLDGVVVTDLPCWLGTVLCQHGLIPVPAPATAFIAEACGLPLTPSTVEGELVTPTGAAVAGALRTQGALPERFTIQRIGMGAGKRASDTSGILRAMIVEPLV